MKKLIGLFASVTLLSSGMALAHGQDKMKEHQTQSQGATGGSGSMGQSGQMGQNEQTGVGNQLSGNQLTGRVVKSDKKMIWLEHEGAIVPLKIDKNTQFTDPSLKRAQDLREGDEIRASYEVRKTDNIATSISKSAGTGGSGQSGTEVMSPDSSINQSPGLPSHEGIGGSGDLSSPDVNKGTGGSSTGSDVNKGSDVDQGSNQNKSSGDY